MAQFDQSLRRLNAALDQLDNALGAKGAPSTSSSSPARVDALERRLDRLIAEVEALLPVPSGGDIKKGCS
ncbi:hypothetical protein [Parvularcula sp. LCG005]|uniref:hypothetical protein n=1 Tax=Parvularcula sp. LCG005 TaxID=3078805 RepID=UPI002942728E|nr:hypothetical protein [Parvularcula sp. LCG005]WOI52826.1 hypothetical protein RUI03_11780 [Parvularcula sp. LCG005]